ncbi:MAG: L-2-hydroxyglutarate oxidase [Rhodobacteraceae bacterium]|nr:L-2-hydroxyglutarate oxidase [Paracoccaceae bacterium]
MADAVVDYLIIGAGIIGAALAAEIARRKPGARILVAEKEVRPAFHQTGRNSGVVHSGVYYTPGSLKARFCRDGLEETRAYCRAQGVAFDPRGKLIVATDAAEVQRLDGLETRAAGNGVACQRIGQRDLHRLEPAITGLEALHIPATAIVDFTGVTTALLAEVQDRGGEIRFNAPLTRLDAQGGAYCATIGGRAIEAGRIIACCGLASDRVARLLGLDPGIRILPFRGEYFVLPKALSQVVTRMIYPVPDPALPFLGVHLTPMIDGTITVGPNAVLSLTREKYGRFSVAPADAADALLYPGLWRLLARHPGASLNELRGSLFRRRYLALVRKYCAQIRLDDLRTYRSANRAQAVAPDGTLVDDFLIKTHGGVTAVLNAPSPAATSALPIARHIAQSIL